ncbi:MAG: hypothetical protein ABR860_00710 [Terracidiphilus sp.]
MTAEMAFGNAVPIELGSRELVLRELNQILESRFFRKAARSKQFLRYVVEYALDGTEPIKERTIGVELFGRRRDYATGDDPVVRVQAAEVRRRLDQYYRALTTPSAIRVQLPVGSYSPVFSEAPVEPPLSPVPFTPSRPPDAGLADRLGSLAKSWVAALICAILLVAGAVAVGVRGSRASQKKAAIDEFWAPVFATPQPVLVCLSMPVVYRPAKALYDEYARQHPGTFKNPIERLGALPLDPHQKIAWGDMARTPDYGVARGDTYAAIALATLMGKIGKPDQVRIGSDYSFGDLKNSPAVVVGAFNNRWTLQITSALHFAFVTDGARFGIREQGANGRYWERHYGRNREPVDDTALVARLLDSATGQFTMIVAGIGTEGTQAASELVTRPELLEPAMRTLPPGWQKKNIEILLQTQVTDFVPGPPRAAAVYVW